MGKTLIRFSLPPPREKKLTGVYLLNSDAEAGIWRGVRGVGVGVKVQNEGMVLLFGDLEPVRRDR